jgi:WD40 repeat protein
VLSGENGEVYVAAAKGRAVLRNDPGSNAWKPLIRWDKAIREIELDSTHGQLITADGKGGLQFWQLENGNLVIDLQAHQSKITSLCRDEFSGIIATGSERGKIALWDHAGREIFRYKIHSGPINALVFSPDGSVLISASSDRSIGRMVIASQEAKQPIRLHRERVQAIAISPDGETLAAGGADNEIALCDAVTGELQALLPGHEAPIVDLEFSDDGHTLYSLSHDGTLRSWKPE